MFAVFRPASMRERRLRSQLMRPASVACDAPCSCRSAATMRPMMLERSTAFGMVIGASSRS